MDAAAAPGVTPTDVRLEEELAQRPRPRMLDDGPTCREPTTTTLVGETELEVVPPALPPLLPLRGAPRAVVVAAAPALALGS